MMETDNIIDTLHRAHLDNSVHAHYARLHRGRSRSTMPATSFVYEFFIFNSLYQYDWERSLNEGVLVPWPRDEFSESAQQARLEKFIRRQCRANPSILRRAFAPICHLEDLHGNWTQITPDARISQEDGQRFFDKLARLQSAIQSQNELAATKAVFDLIEGCRYFVYLVRNNIFHGTKSIGEMAEPNQKRRIEVYDTFLKCLVSAFFLAVDRTPVAADQVQLPIHIHLEDESVLNIGQSEVLDFVVKGAMKPEDSRLIRYVGQRKSDALSPPGERAALFYPSAGIDVLTPLILGLPYCSQFYFYDIAQRPRALVVAASLHSTLSVQAETSEQDGEDLIVFECAGTRREVHLVRSDNRDFLNRDVDLAFYFHRGDSEGEGGSGQEWDSLYIPLLGNKVPVARSCHVLTDAEPGGVHRDLLSKLETIQIPVSHRGRDYYYGVVSGEFLRQLRKPESEARADTVQPRLLD